MQRLSRRLPTGHVVDSRTSRLQGPASSRGGYKIIAVGLYDDLADALDRTARALQEMGLKANRSFIIQTLVRNLRDATIGLDDAAISNIFIGRYLRRPLAAAAPRTVRQASGDNASSKRVSKKRVARPG